MAAALLLMVPDAADRRRIRKTLDTQGPFSQFYETIEGNTALNLLQQHAADVIICDVNLADMSGLQFLRSLQQDRELQDIPLILLTATDDQQLKINMLEQGASDYIVKPYDDGELLARVKVQLRVKTLQDNLKRNNQMLLALSTTDPLTRLHNRRYLNDALTKEFLRSHRHGIPLALIMVDIDHFKQINDYYGHQKGDQVLIQISGLLQRHLRQYDIATRYGGEEFALLLPDTTLEQALQVGERIRQACLEEAFAPPLQQYRASLSLGIATCPQRGIEASPEGLIAAADEALYQAKRQGRNRVISWQDPHNAPS